MDTDNWQSSSGQNIFEMFVEHGGPGFWVRRTTWGGTCARVLRVGELTKPAPYFGNPSVLVDVYSLEGNLREGLAPLPVAGTYKTWRKIEAPAWASYVKLRPLDEPAIDMALAALDRKRGKSKGGSMQASADMARVRLTATFAQRDQAKRIGARWWPEEKTWWLEADNVAAVEKARSLGLLRDT